MGEPDESRERERPPFAEWLVAGFGVLVVLATVGFLGYEAVLGGETPPDIVNRVTAMRPTPGGYLVQVEVRNRGGETTAALTLEGTLKEGGRELETSEVTLDYVPGTFAAGGRALF
jgi:uncharacterized protein (TIGR02588 family)